MYVRYVRYVYVCKVNAKTKPGGSKTKYTKTMTAILRRSKKQKGNAKCRRNATNTN